MEGLSIYYKDRPAVLEVSLEILPRQLTTFIGPSGCGKSSLLGCFNRMNDLVPTARIKGRITFKGVPLGQIPQVMLRRQIGMVFQRPNPFPKSIYNNIALGLRINGYQGDLDERVEVALHQVGLWEDVKDRLRQSALTLSGGQQQRLCLARALALGSEVLLMDEPCASLDPISTGIINDLLNDLKRHYTIVMVTHDLKQAAVVSDQVAFFDMAPYDGEQVGRLVEFGPVPDIFVQPSQAATWDYMYYQALSKPSLSGALASPSF
ncbi:phosphate ABC transporter ATP-binding protein [Leptolyngbya sp. PCC 6406]|uniref:phosphate ABC transporter ATP-binding protein n=1 Tax=Leptolyngbya sp. PCC 6406 TaxID=1173264 RepID=UPI001CEC3205